MHRENLGGTRGALLAGGAWPVTLPEGVGDRLSEGVGLGLRLHVGLSLGVPLRLARRERLKLGERVLVGTNGTPILKCTCISEMASHILRVGEV